MKSLKQQTLRGGLSKLVGQGTNFALRIGSLAVLARLLQPSDFGLVAMVTVVTGVFSLFKDAGLSMATIQRDTISHEQLSTLFWVNIGAGALLAGLTAAAAPILVSFYREPRLWGVTIAIGTGFLINSAGVQHGALLEREMRFTVLTIIDTVSIAVSIAFAIGMAAAGYGYWSLVCMTVLAPTVFTLAAWLACGWVPGKPQRLTEVRSMMRFGGAITVNGLVVYVAYNLEKVLLGRFWGPEILGMYGRAYQLINIPTDNINSASFSVAFAALSRLQEEPIRMRNYFLRGYSMVVSLTLPITIAFGLFAGEIVAVVLGPKWTAAAPIFRLLTPTILVFGLINPFSWLMYSLGLVGRSLRIALVIAPLVITADVLGLKYGPNGVAFAFSSVMTLWLVPHILWSIHDTMISFRDILHAAGRPFLAGVLAAAAASSIVHTWGAAFSPLARLMAGCGVLGAVYLWILLQVMGEKTFYLELFNSLKIFPPATIDDVI